MKLAACLLALAAAGPLAEPAAAQTPPSPEQAKALQAEIQAAVEAETAGTLHLPNPVVQFTAEGDHYNVRVPLAPFLRQVTPADAAVTAAVRPVEGGRWSVSDERYPQELSIGTTEQDLNGPGTPNPSGTHSVPVTYQFKFGTQDRHELIDPTGATPSTGSSVVAPFDMVKTGGAGASLSHFDRITGNTTVQPIDASHSSILIDTAAQNYASKVSLDTGGGGEFNAANLHITSAFSRVARVALARVVRLAFEAAAARRAEPRGSPASPADQERLRGMLAAANGLLSGGKLDLEADGIKAAVIGHDAGLDKLELALSADAAQDVLSASLMVTIDGISVPGLPPDFAAYLPHHLAVRPTATNLNVRDLTKLAMDAITPDTQVDPATGKRPPPTADIQALFSHGGIKLGFDQFSLDIADAHFAGTGDFTLLGPQTLNGVAAITARGLDQLLTRMQANPFVAQAVPVVIFLRGIAKTNGNEALWQVTASNQKVMVNGVDLGAIAGGFAGALH